MRYSNVKIAGGIPLAKGLIIIGIALMSYVLYNQALILLSIILGCIVILFSPKRESLMLLLLWAPFSYIFYYAGYGVFIFLAAAYAIRVLSMHWKITMKHFFVTLMLTGYCLIQSALSGAFTMGSLIPFLLLLLLVLVCSEYRQEDYADCILAFSAGFLIATAVGSCINRFGAMARLRYINIEEVWEAGNATQRFCGIAYDSNFYALTALVLVSVLLFNFDSHQKVRKILLAVFMTAGMFTFSKTYYILLGAVVLFKIITGMRHPMRLLLSAAGGVVVLLFVQKTIGIDLFYTIESRFVHADDLNGLTTGRYSLWLRYIDYLVNHPLTLFFGRGMLAPAIGGRAAHNILLEFMYMFGLTGISLWTMFFYHCFQQLAVNGNSSYKNWVALGVCGVFMLTLNCFYYSAFWVVVFLLGISFWHGRDVQEESGLARKEKHGFNDHSAYLQRGKVPQGVR